MEWAVTRSPYNSMSVEESGIVTITISRASAEDFVSDTNIISAKTMIELEYACLAALGIES